MENFDRHLPDADELAERLAPYGDVSNGLRASKPDDNGLVQYCWRMARFHSGADMHMPMTAFFWLQSYLDEHGIDASVSGIHDDAGKEIMKRIDERVADVLRNYYGLDDTTAARRWKRAGFA